jgi:hypothetical protein
MARLPVVPWSIANTQSKSYLPRTMVSGRLHSGGWCVASGCEHQAGQQAQLGAAKPATVENSQLAQWLSASKHMLGGAAETFHSASFSTSISRPFSVSW